MTTRPNSSADLLRSLDISLLASELPTGDAAKTPPEWIKVTPKGAITTRDGRRFNFDPTRLAARFGTDATDLAVDTDHSVALLGSKGLTPNVIGYVKSVEAREDGTYGRVEWNPAGVAVLAAGTHRYVSPTIHTDAVGNVTWLHSIALVPAPALADMPTLAAVLGGGEDAGIGRLSTLATALDLPETADEAAILAAIGELRSAMVPRATHEATLALLTSTSDKLSALTASTRSGEVTATLDKAIRERKILPAQREEYLALCATDVGLSTFQRLMTKTPDLFPSSGLDGKRPVDSDRPSTATGIIEKAQLLQAEKAKLGIPLTIAEAINAVAPRNHA